MIARWATTRPRTWHRESPFCVFNKELLLKKYLNSLNSKTRQAPRRARQRSFKEFRSPYGAWELAWERHALLMHHSEKGCDTVFIEMKCFLSTVRRKTPVWQHVKKSMAKPTFTLFTCALISYEGSVLLREATHAATHAWGSSSC